MSTNNNCREFCSASVDDDFRSLKDQLAGFRQNVSQMFERLETAVYETSANNKSGSAAVGRDLQLLRVELAVLQSNISEKIENINVAVHQTAGTEYNQIRALKGKLSHPIKFLISY